jgi:hypothetical protein
MKNTYIYIANGERIQVVDFNGKLLANATVPTPPPTYETSLFMLS